MHIPEHVLDPTTCAATGAISAAAIGYALYRVRQEPLRQRLPHMAVTGTFIFAAQMFNVPIAAGSSGHFLGGALAGILLGPWAGMLVMAAVVTLQCLLIGDGGISALGANILNMAVVGAVAGHAVYAKLISQKLHCGVAAAAAAWSSVVASAAICSAELSLGAAYPIGATLAPMLSVHAVIGLGEALIAAAVVAVMYKNPLLNGAGTNWRMAAIGIAGIVVAATLLNPLASDLPDGLETVLSQSQKLAAH